MKINRMTRRMFLQGAGKASLVIPFMNSLWLKEGYAAGETIQPRFIFISAQNGAQRHEDWFPSNDPTTAHNLYTAFGNYPDHKYHTGTIASNATTGISTLFDQKFHKYVSKMNFIKGLDQRFNPFGNHEGAALLGNVGVAHSSVGCPSIPTIDQIMAFTPGFYPNNGVGYVRSMNINPNRNVRNTAYNFSNPYTRTGRSVSVPSDANPYAIFRQMFQYTSATTAFDSSTPVVDSVLEDYKRVRSSRQLSSFERNALDEYIAKLANLEQKFKTDVVPKTAECQNLNPPASIATSNGLNETSEKQHLSLLIDMMILAFQCQRTRLSTVHFSQINGTGEGNSHTRGSWHWASHNTFDTLGRQVMVDLYKWLSDNFLYVLVDRMNSVIESNGLSMLDNSIIHHSTACSHYAHSPKDLPTLLFGSGGGFLKTGNFIDYSNRSSNYGILHNQYLANIMTAMGLKKKDWNMKNLGLNSLVANFPDNADGYGWYKNFKTGVSGSYQKSEADATAPLPGLITAKGLGMFG